MRRSRSNRRRLSRCGVALLITMIVVMLYVILSHHYIYLATGYSQLIANDRDEKVALWSARGGVYRARAQIKLDAELNFDSLNEDWARPIELGETDVAEGVEAEVTVLDEEGKFNIFLLVADGVDPQSKRHAEESFERLVEILRRQDRRLAGIRDYVDDWDEPEANRDDPTATQIIRGVVDYIKKEGREDGTQATFSKDDGSRFGVPKQSAYSLLTIRELLFVERMNERILYGIDPALVTPENPEGNIQQEEERLRREYDALSGERLSRNAARLQEADSRRITDANDKSYSRHPLPLADYITIWGDGRININTASREVLLAMSQHLTWQMVEDIVEARDAAVARERAIEEGNEADPQDQPPPPLAGEDGSTESTVDEDNRSFRAADVASAVAFYNRIYQNISGDRGEEYQPVQQVEQLPQEWQSAFADLQPFLTVRSRHFRVRSTAKVEKIRKTYEAVFRRDAGTAQPQPNQPAQPNQPGQPGQPNQPAQPAQPAQPRRSIDDPVIPDEPNVRVTLLYFDEVD